MTAMERVREAELVTLRALFARQAAPPVVGLEYFADDIPSLVEVIRSRGVHPSENETIIRVIESLADVVSDLERKLARADNYMELYR